MEEEIFSLLHIMAPNKLYPEKRSNLEELFRKKEEDE